MRRTAAAGLYEKDFALWVQQQATALRDGRLGDLDVENLTEEIEDLSRSNRNEVRSRLRQLGAHLLKRQLQPNKATPSWLNTIDEQAASIRDILNDSPSLRREMNDFVHQTYRVARKLASNDTRMALKHFPPEPSPEYLVALGKELGIALPFEMFTVTGVTAIKPGEDPRTPRA